MTQRKKGNQPLRIFLSYASSDRIYADRLQELLSRRPNVRVFTDEMLSAGEDWKSKLKDELASCDIFSVLLSPNSVDSKWVLQELGAAWAIEKPIMPIFTQPGLFSQFPVALNQDQFIDIKDTEKPELLNQILQRYEKNLATSDNGG
jgi:hypothetical protein